MKYSALLKEIGAQDNVVKAANNENSEIQLIQEKFLNQISGGAFDVEAGGIDFNAWAAWSKSF